MKSRLFAALRPNLTESSDGANISEQSPSTARSGKFFFVAKEIFFIGRFGTWLRRGRSSLLHLQVITSRFSRFQNYLSETLLVVHSIIGLFMPHSNPIPNSNLPPGLLLLGLEHLARNHQHLRSLLPNASYLFQLPLLLSKAHFLHLQGKTL